MYQQRSVRGQTDHAASGPQLNSKQQGSNYQAERGYILYARLHPRAQTRSLWERREKLMLDVLSTPLSHAVILKRFPVRENWHLDTAIGGNSLMNLLTHTRVNSKWNFNIVCCALSFSYVYCTISRKKKKKSDWVSHNWNRRPTEQQLYEEKSMQTRTISTVVLFGISSICLWGKAALQVVKYPTLHDNGLFVKWTDAQRNGRSASCAEILSRLCD